jgi:hypothetical protein
MFHAGEWCEILTLSDMCLCHEYQLNLILLGSVEKVPIHPQT